MMAPRTLDYPITLDGRIANERRWVSWAERERDGRLTKVPIAPDGGAAKTNDPATWGTRAEAERR